MGASATVLPPHIAMNIVAIPNSAKDWWYRFKINSRGWIGSMTLFVNNRILGSGSGMQSLRCDGACRQEPGGATSYVHCK